ncbi:hypothetical protein [Olleya sp. UBA1516]|uniref:hypothetical protein n=1 Tax=Olleya sp. UBA1516 TaxID=1947013 RepID=UPI0025E32B1A|nr:hypothetical protein [Olleya sp. UBA1516]|tara:strand:+ start:17660 stop:18136 length:477 start_codon:yes stop_codon:yes gene_type:complete
MKQIAVFLLCLMLASCQYFDVEKTSSEAILKKELKTFNWKEVDSYPSFKTCDTLQSKLDAKQCFETTLANHISSKLQEQTIIVSQDINDTILLSLLISEKGELVINAIEIDSVTTLEIPEIKNIITNSLDTLPTIYPAIKRGQQVKSQFKLPIVLRVN